MTATKDRNTILVVEDNDNVRDIAVEMFRCEGYEVLTATNGNSGFDTFLQHPEIDLVFTDVIMPGGISGIEMTKQIVEKRPGTQVIVVTGYKDESTAINGDAANMNNIAFFTKPYDVDTMLEQVESMLEKTALD